MNRAASSAPMSKGQRIVFALLGAVLLLLVLFRYRDGLKGEAATAPDSKMPSGDRIELGVVGTLDEQKEVADLPVAKSVQLHPAMGPLQTIEVKFDKPFTIGENQLIIDVRLKDGGALEASGDLWEKTDGATRSPLSFSFGIDKFKVSEKGTQIADLGQLPKSDVESVEVHLTSDGLPYYSGSFPIANDGTPSEPSSDSPQEE